MFKILLFTLLVTKTSLAAQLDMEEVKSYFESLPQQVIDEEKYSSLIKLGRKLYLEPRLSINDKISCNSCHQLKKFGVDNEPTSPGHDGTRGGRNSPTSFNAAFHIAQFWDGRAKDLEEQALGPILNPVEMGMPDEKTVVNKIKSIEEYQGLFKKAFPSQQDPITYKNIGVAIAAFEKTLITPSRFDDFLEGNKTALNFEEQRGLQKFISKGCISCHSGKGLGGDNYQKIGVVEEYKTEDLGRYEVTKDPNDKKVFKTPSLRNVAKTAPYFHDVSVKTLDEAIKLMAYHQLGEKLDYQSTREIKAFLNSLTAKKTKF